MDEQETVASAKKQRFSAVSDADLASAADTRVPSSTKTATPFWVRVFKSFCDESGISINLSTCPGSEVNDVLCRFSWFETKTISITSGPPTLRPGQLSAVTELSRPELNLFCEAVFRHSNHVLDGH